jgi:hypothetical protein
MNVTSLFTGLGLLISAALIIIGWSVQRRKDYEQERLKLRLQKRMEITEVLSDHQKKLHQWIENGQIPGALDNAGQWRKLEILVQIYGTEKDRELLREYENANGDAQAVALARFINQLVQSVRTELNFPS